MKLCNNVINGTITQKSILAESKDLSFIKNRQELDEYILNNHIELLIFDCDGTLIDTLESHYESWNEAYTKFNHKFISKQNYLENFAGITGHEMIMQLNKELNYKLNAEMVTLVKEQIFINNYLLNAKPIKPILEIAEYYYKKGIKLVIASGGQRNAVKKLISNNKLEWLFEDIVTIEDVKNGKPSPEIFKVAADRQNIAYQKCMVFEDMEAGFIAAKQANMAFVDIRLLL